MHTKQVSLKTSKEEILKAIDLIVKPIAKTMTPMGSNVLFRDKNGRAVTTNDGATIAEHINPKDELQAIIVDAIVDASKQTEFEAGDATSTTVLLTGNILKLFINNDYDKNEFIKSLEHVKDSYINELEKIRIGGNGKELTDDELYKVAYVSANNNKEIAELSVDVVKKAGEYGSIGFDSTGSKPDINFKEGFIIHDAVPNAIFMTDSSGVNYEQTAIFITDETIFFGEDLNVIIKGAVDSGVTDIILVSSNFQAKTPEILVKTQQQNNGVNILPLQIENKDIINDLGAYLNVPVYNKSLGRVKEETIAEYIGTTDKIEGNMSYILIKSVGDSETKTNRIKLIESLEETDETKQRLASMTSGIVTLTVGGDTPIEREERFRRFEDSIKATQMATKHGYLPGGGSAMWYIQRNLLREMWWDTYSDIAETIGLSNVKQIQANTGIDFIYMITGHTYQGLNANTGEIVDMKEEGIYDSYKAVEQSLLNAVSTSIQLISAMSNTIIINDNE